MMGMERTLRWAADAGILLPPPLRFVQKQDCVDKLRRRVVPQFERLHRADWPRFPGRKRGRNRRPCRPDGSRRRRGSGRWSPAPGSPPLKSSRKRSCMCWFDSTTMTEACFPAGASAPTRARRRSRAPGCGDVQVGAECRGRLVATAGLEHHRLVDHPASPSAAASPSPHRDHVEKSLFGKPLQAVLGLRA